VAARTSSFAFKGTLEDVREVGRRLGVGTVLEGSVKKSGDRLRITVQLIGVEDGYHIWAERFDRLADDIFAIEDEISLGVVEKLKVRLLAGESGVFVRRHEPPGGLQPLSEGALPLQPPRPEDIPRAIELYEKAIAADPDYAMPHVGIAETFFVTACGASCPRARCSAAPRPQPCGRSRLTTL